MFSGQKEIKLGDAIKEFLKEMHIDEKVDEVRALEAWERMMGEHINNRIISKRISKSILYIHLDSAALRYELTFRREELKNAINKTVGKPVVKDIVFT